MNWISGLKPKQMFMFRPKKWATRKWEDEFQVYFNRPNIFLQQTFKLSPGFKSVHAKFVTSTLEPIICSPETSLQFIWSNFAATIISRLLKKWSFCIQTPINRNMKCKIVRKITSYLTSKLSKSPPICSGLPGAPGVPNGFSGMKASTHSKGSETPSALTAMTWNTN